MFGLFKKKLTANENKFNVKNIEESIKIAKENIPDMEW
jgi:hypothetical protein